MPAKVAVIGSGISGIAAAHKLVENNCVVTIFDQGKNPGGRLGLRSLRNIPYVNRPVDVGAAYFTISDPIFESKVNNWTELGLVHQWTDTFHVFDDYEITTTTGPMRYAAKNGLRSLAIHELSELTKKGVTVLQERKIEKVSVSTNNVKVDNEKFDALSAWFVIDADCPKFDAMFVNNHEVVSLIVNDGKRRGDNAPVINVLTTHEYAQPRLENFTSYVTEVVDHALEIWNIKSEVVEKGITRWSIAQPSPSSRPEMPQHMAIVGDAYSEKPRIESAWLDGVAVLNQLGSLN